MTAAGEIFGRERLRGYFGEFWNVPALDGKHQLATPLGEKCYFCDTEILQGDRGTWTPVTRVAGDGEPWVRIDPVHRECNLRSGLGGIAHLEKRCKCYGGTDQDDDGRSVREDALAVWIWVHEHGMESLV